MADRIWAVWDRDINQSRYDIAYLKEMDKLKSPSTVKNHASTLKKFFKSTGYTDPSYVLPEDVMDFKKMLLNTSTVGSTNTHLKRIKAYFNWCVKQGYIALNPADDIKLVAEAEAVPKWLTKEQKGALLRAIQRDYVGTAVTKEKKSFRELLMTYLMLKSGLRVGEVCGLKWADVEISDRKGSILVRSTKTDTQREVGLTSDTLKIFKAYIEKHGVKGEYVFYSRQSDRISERTVQEFYKQYQGLRTTVATLDEITPHMLRHTFAHDLVNGGMQLEAVARLMGHVKKNGQPNIEQTIRYTKQSTTEIFTKMDEILAIG